VYKYEIYLDGGQTIAGEIKYPEHIHDIMRHRSADEYSFEDTEGTIIVKPDRVIGVSFWEEKTKEKAGFRGGEDNA
jgi:hypothetical protein